MKVVTWNINGIRTFKGGIKRALDSLDADIVCLQETKVTRDLLDERCAIVDGYSSYFSFSRGRSGYSGVATYCRDGATPFAAEEGLTGLLTNHEGSVGCYGDHHEFSTEELLLLDNEGRAVITQHKTMCQNQTQTLTVVNVYCPRADPEKPERKQFKLRFYKLLQCRAEALLKSGSHVIVLGDVNTSHRPIDHCDPSDNGDFEENPGRKWLSGFLHDDCQQNISEEDEESGEISSDSGHGGKFVDTFRHFHPTRSHAFTCWNTLTGARQTNYGTRIDYIFADCTLATEQFVTADIMPEMEGSDHCPVWGELSCTLLPSSKTPPLCTRHLPEFAGKQQKLSRFLVKVDQQTAKTEAIQPLPGSQETEERRENVKPLGAAGSSNGKKRTLTVESAATKGKKSKTAKPPSKPQGNLLAFFKPKPTNAAVTDRVTPSQHFPTAHAKPNVPSITDEDVDLSEPARDDTDLSPDSTTDMESDEKNKKNAESLTSVSTGAGPKKGTSLTFWKSVLRGPPQPLPCKVHGEPCVLHTVKKEGPNRGRQFFVCARPQGHASNPEARCNFFAWVDKGK